MKVFDLFTGERLKEQGMALAADNRGSLLEQARDYAYKLAKERRYVTADDVSRAGFELGPAAGSLFRDPRFSWTGRWRKSAKITNHARMIRIWELAE